MNRHVAMPPVGGDSLLASQRPKAPKAVQRVWLSFGRIPCDVMALLGGFALIELIDPNIGHVRQPFFATVMSIILLFGISAVLLQAYSGSSLLSRAKSVTRATLAMVLTIAIFFGLGFLLNIHFAVSRLVLFLGFSASTLLLVAERFFYTGYAYDTLDGSLYTTLILVDRTEHDWSMSPTLAHQATVIEVTDLFDPVTAGPGEYDALARIIGHCDRVIVNCAPDRRNHWAHALKGMNVHAEVMAPELAGLGALGLYRIGAHTTLLVARGPLALRDRILKRAFDVAFSGLALVFLAPLLVLMAIAIKLDSKGPVFFRQPRIGRQNRVFYVYKLRSMRVDALDTGGHRSTSRGDPRITRVGRFIRATSIDELPQFINVLLGDMSVVGPRPHAIFSTAEELLFWDIDRRYWHRHACKPGITGLAQIKGLRGATERRCDLTDRVSADLEYLNNWSFMGDIAIIARTMAVVLHPNAY